MVLRRLAVLVSVLAAAALLGALVLVNREPAPKATMIMPAPSPAYSPLPLPSPSPSPSASSDGKPISTTGSDAVALTFDDGPDPKYTPQLLGMLRASGVKATFCLVGSEAQKYPGLVRDIVREGHSLCNHSWRHDLELGKRSEADIRADLGRTNDAIRRAAPDARIDYYRQPGGVWTDRVVTVARSLGMRSLDWSVDPADWKRPGSEAIYDRVSQQVRPGSIVLSHDAGGERAGTMSAYKRLIPYLRERFMLTARP